MTGARESRWPLLIAALALGACAGTLWTGLDQHSLEDQLAAQARDNHTLLKELRELRARPRTDPGFEARIVQAVVGVVRNDAATAAAPAVEPEPLGVRDEWDPIRQEAAEICHDTLDEVLADGTLTVAQGEIMGEALRVADANTRHEMLRDLSAAINTGAVQIDDPMALDLL